MTMNTIENGTVRALPRYGNSITPDQDRCDARASAKRRFEEADLLDIVSEISAQLLGAWRQDAEPSVIGEVLTKAIEAHLDRVADWKADGKESTKPTPEDAAIDVLLGASVGARQ